MDRHFRTITVGQLRDLLADQPDDALVIFATDYGDYHHTLQALPLEGETEQVLIETTGYSNSGWAVVRRDDEDEDPEDAYADYTPYLLIK